MSEPSEQAKRAAEKLEAEVHRLSESGYGDAAQFVWPVLAQNIIAAEYAEVVRDAERIDWLGRTGTRELENYLFGDCWSLDGGKTQYATLREAIDAAMRE